MSQLDPSRILTHQLRSLDRRLDDGESAEEQPPAGNRLLHFFSPQQGRRLWPRACLAAALGSAVTLGAAFYFSDSIAAWKVGTNSSSTEEEIPEQDPAEQKPAVLLPGPQKLLETRVGMPNADTVRQDIYLNGFLLASPVKNDRYPPPVVDSGITITKSFTLLDGVVVYVSSEYKLESKGLFAMQDDPTARFYHWFALKNFEVKVKPTQMNFPLQKMILSNSAGNYDYTVTDQRELYPYRHPYTITTRVIGKQGDSVTQLPLFYDTCIDLLIQRPK